MQVFPSGEEGLVLFVLVDGRAGVAQAAEESLISRIFLLSFVSLTPHHEPLVLGWILLGCLAELVRQGDGVWALR